MFNLRLFILVSAYCVFFDMYAFGKQNEVTPKSQTTVGYVVNIWISDYPYVELKSETGTKIVFYSFSKNFSVWELEYQKSIGSLVRVYWDKKNVWFKEDGEYKLVKDVFKIEVVKKE